MMQNKSLWLLLVSCVLTACTPSPPEPLKTLDEKLVNKKPEQQQDILENACLNEAEKITGRKSMWVKGAHGGRPVDDWTVKRMKSLCFKMSDAYTLKDDGKHQELAQKCQELLTSDSHSQRGIVVKHTHRMQGSFEFRVGKG